MRQLTGNEPATEDADELKRRYPVPLMRGRAPSRSSDSPEDPHHFLVNGRRWRRTDPGIPESLRAELVHELMRARRMVGEAKRTGDAEAMRLARSGVHDAKVALGERGPAWWEPHSDETLRRRIEAAIRALLRHRGVEKTICPSDVARIVGAEKWRQRMQTVRATALELVAAGELEVRQKGKVVRPEQVRGPIRIGLRTAVTSDEPSNAVRARAKRSTSARSARARSRTNGA